MGPITLFDKSFIQSLSQDEAVWLDMFFLCNIAPPFLIETLADLEKPVRSGRTPEDEVRIIAQKSPDNGCPGINSFHWSSIGASLLGHKVPMTGQILVTHGKDVKVEGKTSTYIAQTPEAEAFQRWQAGQFRELERRVAKLWRATLEKRPNVETAMKAINALGLKTASCGSLAEIKTLVDGAIEGNVPAIKMLEVLFQLQDIGEPFASKVRQRLVASKYIPLRWFAPYAALVLSIDLVFFIGISRGFISGDRPSNKTDFSYLYYLPFCMMFVSSDAIHRTCAPLFLRTEQQFIWGPDLKAALKEINEHYLKLPKTEKAKGVFGFAKKPPKEAGLLVSDLWKKFLRPGILDEAEAPVEMDTEKRAQIEKELLAHVNNLVKKAKAAQPSDAGTQRDEAHSVVIERKVRARRGSWRMFSKEVEESKPDDV